MRRALPVVVSLLAVLAACEDLDSFTTKEGQIYRGEVVDAAIVRKGFEAGDRLEMSFDVTLVEDGPGTITTYPQEEEGAPTLFHHAPLVPISSLSNDQLGGFDFPSGRLRNYMFFSAASGIYEGEMALVVVSLLSDGHVEVRIIMGAQDLYGIFTLQKTTL